jgi:hypothetical protein
MPGKKLSRRAGDATARDSKAVPANIKITHQPQAPSPSWRDVLPVHPAAELFEPLSPDELRALGEDIVVTDVAPRAPPTDDRLGLHLRRPLQ